jgi:hypothetical protein
MKKKEGVTIQINFSNRWLYTFIVLGILAIIGVGVYAYNPTNTPPANPSVMGHSVNEIDFTGGFTVPSGNIKIGTNIILNSTGITTNKICIGTTCKTNLNIPVYSITNIYCNGTGFLTTSDTCLTAVCTGNNNCGSYHYYNHYQCGGGCGFCYSGSSPGGINACPNTLQGSILN